MAEPAFVTGKASQQGAAAIVGLIEDAAAVATAHFDGLADGEEASVNVTLTAGTAYGDVPLGMWGFARAADGTVSLGGAIREDSDG